MYQCEYSQLYRLLKNFEDSMTQSSIRADEMLKKLKELYFLMKSLGFLSLCYSSNLTLT